MYDLIIIGAGPAGMTAAIYAARQKVKFLILSMDVGGQMNWSSEVNNYPGKAGVLTGIELTGQFQKHLEDYKIKIKSAEILKLSKRENICVVKTRSGVYESMAVIIATGKKPRKLGVPGEEKLLGKGDMIIKSAVSTEIIRLHGSYISTDDIEKLINHFKS